MLKSTICCVCGRKAPPKSRRKGLMFGGWLHIPVNHPPKGFPKVVLRICPHCTEQAANETLFKDL